MAKYGLDDLQLKAQADTLTHTKLFTAIIEDMKASALSSWASTSPADIQVREDAYHEYKAIEKINLAISNTLSELAAKDVTER